MKRTLSIFILAAVAFVALPALAQTSASTSSSASAASQAASSTASPAAKPAAKKKPVKKAVKKDEVLAVDNEESKEPDVAASTVVDYQCEMGNKLTIFRNNDDDQHIALKWGKRLHRLTRVDTTTGASRFENRYYGLVWIGIPSKGMLLDSKQGHQLANECKTAEQLAPKEPEPHAATQATPEQSPAVPSGAGATKG